MRGPEWRASLLLLKLLFQATLPFKEGMWVALVPTGVHLVPFGNVTHVNAHTHKCILHPTGYTSGYLECSLRHPPEPQVLAVGHHG